MQSDSAKAGRTKSALAVGFGGVVVLLIVLGFFAANALRQTRAVASSSTQAYLSRRTALNEVRRAVFAAGTHVRDYLLDPSEGGYTAHAVPARAALARASEALNRNASPQDFGQANLELAPLSSLGRELDAFAKLAEGAFAYAGQKRRALGYDLLTGEISPARDKVLAVLDQLVVSDQASLERAVAETTVSLDRLQSQLWIAIGLSVLLASGLALLTYRHLANLESIAAERYQQSRESALAMEQLSHRLLVVQEEERKSLARELHDEVGQSLGALLVDLSQARATLAAGQEETRARLDAATRLTEHTLASVRDMSLLLRPSILDDLGLVPALHWQAREVSRRTGMLVSFHSDQEDLELDDERRTAIFRVVQEALNNAARHSGARSAEVGISARNGRLHIQVSDNGKGFEPDVTHGLGLLGMQERVARLMGTFRIASGAGRGTVITVDLPLDGAAPA